MGQAALLSGLQAAGLGDRVLTDPAALVAFSSDALTAFHQRPVAVVVAESEDDVVTTVRLCHRHGVPFVARGSGTSLSGGSVPVEGGIVIALNRLDRVLHLDPEARTLLQVKVNDLAEADDIFSKLMGDVVEPRREFIQANALSVENLDF